MNLFFADDFLVPKRDPQLQTHRKTRQNDHSLYQNGETPQRTPLVQLPHGDYSGAQVGAHIPPEKNLVPTRVQTRHGPIRASSRHYVRHVGQQTQNPRHAHELQAAMHTLSWALSHRPHTHRHRASPQFLR